MVFNSTEFLFLFLPITITVYFLLNRYNKITLSKIWLVLCSLYFYSFNHTSYIFIILFSKLFNYIIGTTLIKQKNLSNIYRKLLFLLGLVLNIGMLGYFKYTDFFIFNFNKLFGTDFSLMNILLPLGISFFTFQQVSYIIDSYNGKDHTYNFLDYCLFVTFFPQLVAGPIVLPSEMLPQFHNKNNKDINYDNMNKGLYFMAIGLMKKVFIADTLARIVNFGFGNPTTLTMMDSILTSFSYTFQLYFDFSGYCDIAMGIALMFNIKLPINFDSPYKSTNIKEFWRRWHMTLGRFLTNYLYYPLGGSRKGFKRTLINLMLVFLISGIWHGAGWTFIIWGALHGVSIVIHRIWCRYNFKLPKIIGWFITFNLVNIFWVFFRASDLSSALSIIKNMFNLSTLAQGFSDSFYIAIVPDFKLKLVLVLALLISFLAPSSVKLVKNFKYTIKTNIIIILYFVISIFIILSTTVSTFLYFNF